MRWTQATLAGASTGQTGEGMQQLLGAETDPDSQQGNRDLILTDASN